MRTRQRRAGAKLRAQERSRFPGGRQITWPGYRKRVQIEYNVSEVSSASLI